MASEKKLMRFRILAGMHVERRTLWKKPAEKPPELSDETWETFDELVKRGEHPVIEKVYVGPVYRNGVLVKDGDVIETTNDLCKQNGKPPCEPKFQRLYREMEAEQLVPSIRPTDDLDDLDEATLRKVCDDDEIDHSKLKTKPQLVKAIRTQRALVPSA
jgi:hypothetical protein